MKPLLFSLSLMLLLSQSAIAAGQDDGKHKKASLSSSQAFIGDDEFEVEFTAIDGSNIPRRNYIALAPGSHVITVRVPARFTNSRINRGREAHDDYVDFEVDLEPGQSYALYGQWNRLDRDHPYDLVLELIE